MASVLSSVPIRYMRSLPPQDLSMAWRPRLFLADTGLRSSTKDCVAKVAKAARPDLDERMARAVTEAIGALLSEQADCTEALAGAMKLAASCFEEWGLGADEALTKRLTAGGALAVKPTGSGGGGYLLSLWSEAPPAELGLIPVGEDSSKDP